MGTSISREKRSNFQRATRAKLISAYVELATLAEPVNDGHLQACNFCHPENDKRQQPAAIVRCFRSRPLGMDGEQERPEAPPSWSSMANKQPQKATAAAAILGWLLSLAAARGVQVPVDPGVLLRIDRGTGGRRQAGPGSPCAQGRRD